jgi:hypothetical protein
LEDSDGRNDSRFLDGYSVVSAILQPIFAFCRVNEDAAERDEHREWEHMENRETKPHAGLMFCYKP